jgi:hypothetical protein
LIVFTSSFAQKLGRRDERDDEDEPDGNIQQQEAANKPKSRNRISLDNANNDDGSYQRPVPRQQPQAQPQSSSSTPLASSRQCQSDVQKYCNKGSPQLISNLKVLQCVDDLDNVSF